MNHTFFLCTYDRHFEVKETNIFDENKSNLAVFFILWCTNISCFHISCICRVTGQPVRLFRISFLKKIDIIHQIWMIKIIICLLKVWKYFWNKGLLICLQSVIKRIKASWPNVTCKDSEMSYPWVLNNWKMSSISWIKTKTAIWLWKNSPKVLKNIWEFKTTDPVVALLSKWVAVQF